MSKPLQTTSGDILADRRADYAEMLFASGDHAAAAELLTGALELVPDWSFGWFRLGEFHEAAGTLPAAVEAWRMSLRLDPADRVGAALKLQLAGQGEAASPGAFAEALFDQYAKSFDHSLVEKLGYRVPDLLAEVLSGRRFRLAIDLGCGTGLMGEKLRSSCDRIEGYDISAEMLRKADAKRLYDHLGKVDLQSMTYSGAPSDLVVAADVFMYLGELATVTSLVHSMLEHGGTFAFSVEAHDGAEPFVLRESRRYAHSEKYVRETLADAGFEVRTFARAVIRRDRNEPLEGYITVATKER